MLNSFIGLWVKKLNRNAQLQKFLIFTPMCTEATSSKDMIRIVKKYEEMCSACSA